MSSADVPADASADACADTPVGLIGLGLVGRALAGRLRAAGFQCIGFDLRPQALADFRSAGFATAASVPELAGLARTLVLAVFETSGVLHIAEGHDPVQSLGRNVSTHPGMTFIDCSTGEPEALSALAQRLNARGIGFIEAPLSGSSEQIAAGEATMLMAGRKEHVAAQTRVLDALARKRIYLGGAGMGARAKLATNLVLGLNRAALAEGMVFAQTQGIDPKAFLELVMNTPAHSGAAQAKGEKMVNEDFSPQSRIVQHLKDVRLMIGIASQTGQRLPLSEAHANLMTAAIAAGDGELDNAAIIRQIRRDKT